MKANIKKGRSMTIGNEHIRHQLRLKEIMDFYEILDRRGIEKGKKFILSVDEGVMECLDIKHDDLTIEYCKYLEGRTIVTDKEFCRIDVATYKKYYQ